MEKQTVLILGITGMLGHKLFSVLCKNPGFETHGTIRGFKKPELFKKFKKDSFIIPDFDIMEPDRVENEITKLKPNWVINCVGIIKQLKEANESIPAISINSLFPHQLALICQKNNTKVLHISTDCVFSGTKGNYTEDDVPDATDLYGRTKSLGELTYSNSLTIRTSIIGHELNSKNGLLEWFLSQEREVNGYTNAIFSGFTTLELSKIIVNNLLNSNLTGIYHIASKAIRKFDLLETIAQVYDKKITINESGNFACNRSLNPQKFRMSSGYDAPDWEIMIKEMYDDYKLNYIPEK